MNIKLNELMSFLGKTSKDEPLIRYFSSISVDISDKLSLPDGEYRVYIDKPELGISIAFTDEAIYLDKENQPIGMGLLYFSDIFLYSEGKDGHSQFKGILPVDISFNSDYNDISSSLGSPSWSRNRSDGSLAAARWDSLDKFRLHITFSKDTKMPTVININSK
ncbi:hypothetical protein ABDK09_01990 [Vibrio sp. CDRSL-10 TSBA]